MLIKKIKEILIKDSKTTQSKSVNLTKTNDKENIKNLNTNFNKKYIHNIKNTNSIININSNVIDIDVRCTNEEHMAIYIENSEYIKNPKNIKLDIENINNTININLVYKSINISSDNVVISGRNNVINFSYSKGSKSENLNSVKLRVDIPKKDFCILNMKAESISADINIKGVNIENTLNLKTNSGDVSLKNVKSKNTNINTISGEIFIDSSKIGDMMLKSTSGEIVCENINTNNLKANSVSGDIDICKGIGEKLDIKSTSGDILVSTIQYQNVNLKTVSGDISLNNKAVLDFEIKHLNTSTISGNEKVFANCNMF